MNSGLNNGDHLVNSGTKLSMPKFDEALNYNKLNSWIHNIKAYFKTLLTLIEVNEILVDKVHMEEQDLTWW
jgi:hypothetical protein